MYNTSFFKKILLIATVAVFYSCDKDFNAIGDDIIGDNHFGLDSTSYKVKAYNQKVTPVIANNLEINALGIYNNPAFGLTTANFNTQVALDTYGSELGEGVIIDSVTLHIPYFLDRTQTVFNTDAGKTKYVLDSIYGPETGKIKLSVYESGIFLNDYKANDPVTSNFYYTDKNSEFQLKAVGGRLNNFKPTKVNKDGVSYIDESENDIFFFNSKELFETTEATTTTPKTFKRFEPEMRLHLDTIFFRNKIFNAPAGKLASAEAFKNYFRGLYFKVENSGSEPGSMAMLDFKKGKINVFYRAKTAITTDAATATESKTLVINLNGNTTSLLEESNPNQKYSAATEDDLSNQVPVEDEKLYLKGGQGSMAIIELSEFESQLADIRKNVIDKKWLVNEANLIFYVDETEMNTGIVPPGKPYLPQRVYLYDATNNTPIIDYFTDGSTFSAIPKKNKYVFDGMIQKITQKGNTYKIYKVRITDHIRNILKNSTVENVKLGLVVTENIAIGTSNKLDPKSVNSSSFTEIPTASVMSPLGTVLFGGTAASADKRVKLQVYYTKPNL
ncbi:DUF4270 domain-containing protein [Flavobacterium sp.]|uniref:DUF4270 domain-containing protein n=1 Tax=Flavobacterium sp. TaxID=239 RepID=UPI003264D94B